MDIGLGFDDTDFEFKEKVTATAKTSYNAKVCEPLWFEKEQDADASDYIHQLKFSADYHFHQGNYEVAAAKYEKLLDLIPTSNMPLRQDVEESLCRSYTKLNRHREATQVACRLLEMMRKEDAARQRQSLLLLYQACKGAEDWTGCILALEELASRQSHYAHFWLEMGRAYSGLGQESGDHCQHHVQIATCYARARLLYESVLNTVGKVAKEKNERSISQIEIELKEMNMPEQLLSQATERMRADLDHGYVPAEDEEKESSGNTHDEISTDFNSAAFRRKWFSWIEQT